MGRDSDPCTLRAEGLRGGQAIRVTGFLPLVVDGPNGGADVRASGLDQADLVFAKGGGRNLCFPKGLPAEAIGCFSAG